MPVLVLWRPRTMGWDWIFGSELCSPFDCGFAYHAPREPVGGHTVPLTTSLAFAVFPGEKGPLVSMSVVSMKKPTYRDFRMVGFAGFGGGLFSLQSLVIPEVLVISRVISLCW